MSKFDYSKARATAEKVINNYGGAGTVYELGSTSEDMIGNVIIIPGKIIDGRIAPLIPYKTSTQMTSYEKDNVIAGDKYTFFHSSEKVAVGMLVDAEGYTWRIESISILDSTDGINVFQKIMLRH